MFKQSEASPPTKQVNKNSSFDALDQQIDLIDECQLENEKSVSDSDCSEENGSNVVVVPSSKDDFVHKN